MKDHRRKFLKTVGLSADSVVASDVAVAQKSGTGGPPAAEAVVQKNRRRSSAAKARLRAWRSSRTG
jgi:hypothetical protein